MRNAIRATVMLLVSAGLASFVAAQEEYTLKLQVKEGDTFKYRHTMEMTFGEMSIVSTTNITNKVIRVDADGNVVMESSYSDGMMKVGDQEIPIPASPATRTTLKPNGMPVKVEWGLDSTDALRMGQFTNFFPEKAVKIGDKWSAELKGDGSALAIKAEYELVAKEKVGDLDTLKIKVTSKLSVQEAAKEGGMPSLQVNASGHIWIDPKTGMLVRMTAKVKGMPAEGAPMPLDGTLTMERIP
jgi:copper(I)-binding protein